MDRHDADPSPEGRTDPEPGIDPLDHAPVVIPPVRFGPSGQRLYTLEELPRKSRLRVENAGKWVAWSADGESILASASELPDLDKELKQAGITGAVYEWLEPMTIRMNHG